MLLSTISGAQRASRGLRRPAPLSLGRAWPEIRCVGPAHIDAAAGCKCSQRSPWSFHGAFSSGQIEESRPRFEFTCRECTVRELPVPIVKEAGQNKARKQTKQQKHEWRNDYAPGHRALSEQDAQANNQERSRRARAQPRQGALSERHAEARPVRPPAVQCCGWPCGRETRHHRGIRQGTHRLGRRPAAGCASGARGQPRQGAVPERGVEARPVRPAQDQRHRQASPRAPRLIRLLHPGCEDAAGRQGTRRPSRARGQPRHRPLRQRHPQARRVRPAPDQHCGRPARREARQQGLVHRGPPQLGRRAPAGRAAGVRAGTRNRPVLLGAPQARHVLRGRDQRHRWPARREARARGLLQCGLGECRGWDPPLPCHELLPLLDGGWPEGAQEPALHDLALLGRGHCPRRWLPILLTATQEGYARSRGQNQSLCGTTSHFLDGVAF